MSCGIEWSAGSLPASIAATPRHSWLRPAYLHSISLSTAYRLHTLHVLRELSRPRTLLPLDYPLTSPHHGHFKLPSEKTLLSESLVSIGLSPGAPFHYGKPRIRLPMDEVAHRLVSLLNTLGIVQPEKHGMPPYKRSYPMDTPLLP